MRFLPIMMKHTEELPNILLVDDLPANLLALEGVLEPLGCNLIRANSGKEALAWLLDDKDCALILLDVQMPGMDGFETATLIKEREKTSHIPIIFITAASKEERFVSQGYTVGAVDYIPKPFDADILKSKVVVFVDLFRCARQNQRQGEQLLQAERRRQVERRAVQRQRAHQDRLHLAELAASEARLIEFKSTVDSTLDGVFMFDAHTLNFTYTNHGGIGQLGYAAEEILTLTPLDFLSQQDAAVLRDKLSALREGTLPSYTFETRHKRKDGSEVPIELSLQFITPEGKTGRFVAVARDITERKKAEAMLLESEARFRTAISEAPVPIMIHREDGKVLQISKGWTDCSGYELEDIPTIQDWAERAYGEGSAGAQEYVKSLYEIEDTRSDGEWTVIAKNGQKRVWNFITTPLGSFGDSLRVVISTAFDITEIKQAQEAEQESKRFLQATIDALPAHLAVLDETGHIIAINQAWRQFSDHNEGTAAACGVGANYVKVSEDASGRCSEEGSEVGQGIQAVLNGESQAFCLEYPCHSPTEERWFNVCATPFTIEGVVHVLVAHEDITSRAQAEKLIHASEANLVRAQKMAQLGNWNWTLQELENFAVNPLSWSDEIFHIFGYQPGEIKASYELFINSVHSDDRASVEAMLHSAIETGRNYSIEHRVVRPDGTERIVQERSDLIYDENGRPTNMVGTVQDITERKQAEAFLTESQQRLALATESAQIGIFDWNIVEDKLIWDTQLMALYGIGEQDFTGALDVWQNGLHPQDRDAAEADLNFAVNGDRDFSSQFRVLWPNGEVHHLEAHGLVQRTEDGVAQRIIGVNWDVTQRKLDEATVERSEERYRSLTLATAQIVWTTSATGMVVEDMPTWRIFTGQSVEEILGWGWIGAAHPEDREKIETTWAKCLETESLYESEYRMRAADGEYRLFSVRGVPIFESSGGIREWIGTSQDIHDHRQAEEERDRFFTLSLDMLAIIGSDGYFKRVNPAWEVTLGFSTAEILAVPFIEFVHPDDVAATIKEAAELVCGGELMRFENRYCCRDGSYKWLLWMCATFEDLIYCVAHDITDAKEAEEALRQANDQLEGRVMERTAELEVSTEKMYAAKQEADSANLAKSEFLSRMSHELRTPLNAILGFGQILDKRELDPLAKESIGYILKGGRHLLDLINEVLDIARVEAGKIDLSLEPIALIDVVPDACALIRPLASERNIRLEENSMDLRDHYILADRQRIKQVIINLVSNAIKYNREGGQVKLICSLKSDERVTIAVHDTGPGISSEDLLKLFTPFERLGASASQIEGTGLGLVLSQRLVTSMGGTLSVESTLGVGTTFTLEMPQTTAPEAQVTNEPETPRGAESTPEFGRIFSVLCIEDNPSNLRLMEAIFEDRPEITLLAAMQGSVGLDLARQHEPDLILLDLDLPDIHGGDVLARLQQSAVTRDIPVIVVSADATPKQIERLLAAGAKSYLTKPLDVGQFLHEVDKFLQPPLDIATQPSAEEENS